MIYHIPEGVLVQYLAGASMAGFITAILSYKVAQWLKARG